MHLVDLCVTKLIYINIGAEYLLKIKTGIAKILICINCYIGGSQYGYL